MEKEEQAKIALTVMNSWLRKGFLFLQEPSVYGTLMAGSQTLAVLMTKAFTATIQQGLVVNHNLKIVS